MGHYSNDIIIQWNKSLTNKYYNLVAVSDKCKSFHSKSSIKKYITGKTRQVYSFSHKCSRLLEFGSD